MDLGVRNRGFLLIGGTSGIGLATAHVLANDGARLFLVGRSETKAQEAAAKLKAAHNTEAAALSADISRGQVEAERVVAEAHKALGGLDGIAITTGTSGVGRQELAVSTDESWQDAFADVLLATAGLLRAALPILVSQGRGSIVTTAAYSIRDPSGHRSAYTALKGAVAVLTKDIAKSYGPHGVRANCVCPGAIKTEESVERIRVAQKTAGDTTGRSYEDLLAQEWKLQPALERPGTPDEIGDVYAFLLSQRAAYLTGAVISVDGGTNF